MNSEENKPDNIILGELVPPSPNKIFPELDNVSKSNKSTMVTVNSIFTSTRNNIIEKRNDQNFNQRVGVLSTIIFEIYRVVMGAFLMVFVPQNCGGDICSMVQNVERNDTPSRGAIYLNSITLLSFLMLYIIEIQRENKLITYLDVNKFNSTDNKSVGIALLQLTPEKMNDIWDYDKMYQKSGYICISTFIINSVCCAFVINNHYLDTTTLTVFLTNVLFMGLKVSDVYSIVNTKKNIFYSAYLKQRIQFNDVDVEHIVQYDNINNINNVKTVKNDENDENDLYCMKNSLNVEVNTPCVCLDPPDEECHL
jgi:hypothetical protein